MAKKYREKPCNEVKAFQWDGENIDIAYHFIEKQYHHEVSVICGRLWIKNSKNTVIAKKGDYIVKGTDGEFYVCEQDVFEKVYGEVKEPKIIMVGMLQNIVNLYERLAKDGIECTMTVDDKNGICTIYSYGIELADDPERINKSFEDVLGEEENDQ